MRNSIGAISVERPTQQAENQGLAAHTHSSDSVQPFAVRSSLGNPPSPPITPTLTYDPELGPGYFVQTRSDFLRFPGFSPTAKVLYLVLCSYAGAGADAWPGQLRLARECGVSERTIRDVTNDLVRAGLLTVKQQGLNRPNLYHVHKLPTAFPPTTSSAQPTLPALLPTPNIGNCKGDRQNLPVREMTRERQNLPVQNGNNFRSRPADSAGELHPVKKEKELTPPPSPSTPTAPKPPLSLVRPTSSAPPDALHIPSALQPNEKKQPGSPSTERLVVAVVKDNTSDHLPTGYRGDMGNNREAKQHEKREAKTAREAPKAKQTQQANQSGQAEARGARKAGRTESTPEADRQTEEDARLLRERVGVDERTAWGLALLVQQRRGVGRCSVGYVAEVVEYATSAQGITNPAGLVVELIRRNERRRPAKLDKSFSRSSRSHPSGQSRQAHQSPQRPYHEPFDLEKYTTGKYSFLFRRQLQRQAERQAQQHGPDRIRGRGDAVAGHANDGDGKKEEPKLLEEHSDREEES